MYSLHRHQNYNFGIAKYNNIKLLQIFEHIYNLVQNDVLLNNKTSRRYASPSVSQISSISHMQLFMLICICWQDWKWVLARGAPVCRRVCVYVNDILLNLFSVYLIDIILH
jgi:hypothetical protein